VGLNFEHDDLILTSESLQEMLINQERENHVKAIQEAEMEAQRGALQ
jgi:hypothetical protein